MIIGLAMFYAWVHSVVIIAKKVKGVTAYETVVMIFGAVAFVLYMMGTM